MKSNKKIILASTSPRRKELLEKTRLKFKMVSTDYEEDMGLKMKPLALAKFLSRGKAEAVAKKYKSHIIIAADTFVALGDKLLGKPRDEKEACEMLRRISGKAVSLITGYTVIDTSSGKEISRASGAKVFIKRLSDQEIINYVKTKEPLDKAGAFAVQGIGAVIVRKIEGDFFSIMGLPLYDLAQTLREFGIRVL